MKKNFLFKNKYAKGFTLMEVMVSVTIFSIIVTIGMGALITIFKTLQKTRAQRQAIDSVSYVLDTITRRIRTGSGYGPTTTGDNGISFSDQNGDIVSFYSNTVDQQNRLFMIDASRGTERGPFDITPENFTVDNFDVELKGNDHSGSSQPLVLIHLVGTVRSGQQTSRVSVQTIVSQRLLDFASISADPLMKTGTNPVNNIKSLTGSILQDGTIQKAQENSDGLTGTTANEVNTKAFGTANVRNRPRTVQ